ncbi:membrane-associated protein, putative [Bodo saltans]|uniref:Membrane-associated protein, putative n=1 Tax=Bodo saltans TaxID=75058 RepID=A0A0S4JAA3_BODSA|nr:membrane-associated protein, putative [Bodo saltans]|eukprot:CUG85818.1 membrane-associated protein, putative [Bodo saltans]
MCEPHLPRWFLRIAGSWLLPRVMWEPKELKLQYGEFFSSVASIDAMRVAPLLQVHGAVFSLIAAIPFPQFACAAQFVLAIVWMCVPVALLLRWELKLLRRPPSNPLVLLSNLVVFGVLIATLVFVEGPVGAQDAAASARDALGDVLTAVSILNTCITAVGTAAEMIARRSSDVVAETGKLEFIRGDREAEWDHNVLREPQQHFAQLQTDALELLIDGMLDGVEEVVTEASRDDKGRQKEIYNQKCAVVHKLDDCIERITNDPLFVAARNQRGNQRDLSQNNDRVLRFTLKLLVTRAARGGGSRPSRK